jgi:hypothetical protein
VYIYLRSKFTIFMYLELSKELRWFRNSIPFKLHSTLSAMHIVLDNMHSLFDNLTAPSHCVNEHWIFCLKLYIKFVNINCWVLLNNTLCYRNDICLQNKSFFPRVGLFTIGPVLFLLIMFSYFTECLWFYPDARLWLK